MRAGLSSIVLVAAAVAHIGCARQGSKPGPTDESCIAGTRGCPCDLDHGCNEGLGCADGFCVPTHCTRGAPDCACHPDGTCDPLDGRPLTCAGNICVVTAAPEPGALGGACSSEVSCGAADGVKLRCANGVCELPGCPSGSLGCPCGPYGACDSFEGAQARCLASRCSLGACAPGTAGCQCIDGSQCNAGLACGGGWCRSGSRAQLTVGDAAARACDVLLLADDRSHLAVRFAGSVVGHHVQRAPKLALSFISSADVALSEPVAVIDGPAGGSPVAGLHIDTAECFDRLGVRLQHPSVIIE